MLSDTEERPVKDETVRISRKESSALSSDAFAFPTGIWIYENKIIIH